MYLIPLASLPNQRIALTLDGFFWEIFIYQAIDEMACDINRNGVSLVSGSRCTACYGLLPYDWMWNSPAGPCGNFVFSTEPDWTNFADNGSCQLYYLTNAEYQSWLQTLVTT